MKVQENNDRYVYQQSYTELTTLNFSFHVRICMNLQLEKNLKFKKGEEIEISSESQAELTIP